MGLSVSYKPNFVGLLKILNNFNWFIVFFSLINLSVCIYEDQIGKFDWRQTYVGRIKFSQFDTVSTAKKLIVATEENVLAALNLKTGQVVWRHVFESASTGNIQLLHVSEKVVTVSGVNPYLVRGWHSTTGVLLWEWSLTLQNSAQAEFSEWWVQNDMLVHMMPVFSSHIEVTMYYLTTGQNRGSTSKLPAIWINDGCVLSPPYYSCISGSAESQMLLSLDVTSNAVQILSKPLSQYITNEQDSNLRPLDGFNVVSGFILADTKIIIIKDNEFVVASVGLIDQMASVTIIEGTGEAVIMQVSSDDVKGFSLVGNGIESGKEIIKVQDSNKSLKIPEPEISSVVCSHTARDVQACRLLLVAADDAMHLMQHEGRILWSREEALANVVAVEFVDLPVSELDAAIESEFDQKEGSVWAAFSRRLHTQLQQLEALLHSLQAPAANRADEPRPLVRDYFNLHKIIVLVTDVGKIFGMDNLSGEILWQRYEPNLDTEGATILPRRSARHPPYDALITIVGKHAETGNGLILSLNPVRGTLSGEGLVMLDTSLLQCAILPQADPEWLHGLLLLDQDENVQMFPQSAAPLVKNLYMYVAFKSKAVIQGYALRYDGSAVVAQKTWSVNTGGGAPGHRLVALASRARGSRTHSAGRALPDRSVLYKYDNPNLVLAVSHGPDPLHKDVVVATVVDGVSGAVVAAQTTRRARALPLAIHADNLFAYFYYSDKNRRTEIATLELYEGKERWLAGGAAFSAWRPLQALQARRAAFVVPAAARALAATRTERALTDLHLLVGLSTGSVVSVPWAQLEGPGGEAPPPAPELPLPADAALAYNRSLARVALLAAAPAGLESTSLVLAAGLGESILPADAALAYNRSLARVALLAAAPAGLESTSLVLAAGLGESILPADAALAYNRSLARVALLAAAPAGLESTSLVLAAGLGESILPADAALAYNRSLARVALLAAAPAGLESTSLVLAAGLDLFYTRVAPSKTFDLLKDDFDYYLIGVVLTALVVATYATKYFASRKTLQAAWK